MGSVYYPLRASSSCIKWYAGPNCAIQIDYTSSWRLSGSRESNHNEIAKLGTKTPKSDWRERKARQKALKRTHERTKRKLVPFVRVGRRKSPLPNKGSTSSLRCQNRLSYFLTRSTFFFFGWLPKVGPDPDSFVSIWKVGPLRLLFFIVIIIIIRDLNVLKFPLQLIH